VDSTIITGCVNKPRTIYRALSLSIDIYVEVFIFKSSLNIIGIKMLNILYLSHTGTNIGGGENRLFGLLKNLDRSLYNPIVVCPDKAGEFYAKLKTLNIPVYICRLPGWRKLKSYPFRRFAAKRLSKLANNHNIGLVHTSDLWLNYYADKVGESLNIPIITHVRNLLEPESIPKYSFNKFDQIIAISQKIKDPLVEGGISSEKIKVVYNGIELSKFTVEKVEQNVIRKDYSLKKHLVALVGRIEPFKRQKEFVHIISEVIRERQDVSFLFIGEPPQNRNDYLLEIKQIIKEYNLDEYIIFTGYRSDMPEVFSSIDLLVSLSAGGVVIEAMASGLPVVGADIASASEMIDDGVTGIVCPLDDIRGISEAILSLLEEPELRNKMGKAGRERVEKLFDVRKNTKIIESIYVDIL